VRVRAHAVSSKRSSVREDWCAWLPARKAEVFSAYVRQFDCTYGMFSVALNEALELRKTGKLSKSCRAVFVIPGLCSRLAESVGALLRSIREHAKHYGTVPNAAPLDPGNFLGAKEIRTARVSDLLGQLLLTRRSHFLHKVGTLQSMVETLGCDFRRAAEDLGCGVSARPAADWQTVDSAHYDLNTCLREAIVVLKSFLVILPDDQLGVFQKTVSTQMRADYPSDKVQPLPRHRRIAPIARE
jgi:hypothetical protein